MLLCQQCSGHQHADLSFVIGGNKGRAHGNFRFTETDVAAHQSVHHSRAVHVFDHRLYRGVLVGCFLEWEGRGELLIGLLIAGKREALPGLASRVDLQ